MIKTEFKVRKFLTSFFVGYRQMFKAINKTTKKSLSVSEKTFINVIGFMQDDSGEPGAPISNSMLCSYE